MLTLKRKKEQKLVFHTSDGVIEIYVDRPVRVAITAPPEVKILRGELEPFEEKEAA